jgi:hypothetical protein
MEATVCVSGLNVFGEVAPGQLSLLTHSVLLPGPEKLVRHLLHMLCHSWNVCIDTEDEVLVSSSFERDHDLDNDHFAGIWLALIGSCVYDSRSTSAESDQIL